jgi:hypothetical protein
MDFAVRKILDAAGAAAHSKLSSDSLCEGGIGPTGENHFFHLPFRLSSLCRLKKIAHPTTQTAQLITDQIGRQPFPINRETAFNGSRTHSIEEKRFCN